MKIVFRIFFMFLPLSIIVFSITCKKEKMLDERDDVTGNYKGILIQTLWNDSILVHDTSNIEMTLVKSNSDSIIELRSNPILNDPDLLFHYHNKTFICTNPGSCHWLELIMSNDSLYFHRQCGLGPYWIDCKVKKN
jgi:hypothetical protein